MKFSFCPKCGQALRYQATDGQVIPVCQNPACAFLFWQNSKPTVCVLIPDAHGNLLMTTRSIEPAKGKLDLPGGFLHESEHPIEGAQREIKEELGLEITIAEHAGYFIDRYGTDGDYTLNIGLVADIISGKPEPADDVATIAWLNVQDIDRTQLAFANCEYFLDWWLKHHS